MLEFDFRNGPLRRKYDGLKYCLKNLEDLSFELSLRVGTEDDRLKKKRKLDSDAGEETDILIDTDEIKAIRDRMDSYDKLREKVIKDCRDVQKLAKQSIFAVIRGSLDDARKKIANCIKFAEEVKKIINEVNFYFCKFDRVYLQWLKIIQIK